MTQRSMTNRLLNDTITTINDIITDCKIVSMPLSSDSSLTDEICEYLTNGREGNE